ncbi:MAG: extracellular solute-binding protein, partial [Dehalococcoidia bacterium]|nr:extracellular solute-binding protein [Dehalococcoidia bacterium]
MYSGRSADLVGPLIADFEKSSGISVEVKYGSTVGLTATLMEEGDRSPADIFFSQDIGVLGRLAAASMLAELPEESISDVDRRFVDSDHRWAGTSGRARVVVYNTDTVDLSDLPETLEGYTAPQWAGRVGWAPTNASFQSFVTALRRERGSAAALVWLRAMKTNDVKDYKNNSAIVQAVSVGDIDVGFANHYYLYRFIAEEGESFPARNYHPAGGELLGVFSAAGVGMLAASDSQDLALEFVEFLLSEKSQ